jgi:hypothetical protein
VPLRIEKIREDERREGRVVVVVGERGRAGMGNETREGFINVTV